VARYCTEALERGAAIEAGWLALIGWTIDLAVALAAYLVVLFGSKAYLLATLGEAHYRYLLIIYGLTMVSGATLYTSQALLQVFGRFDLMSLQSAGMGLLRLILVALVYWRGWGLPGVVLAVTFASVIEGTVAIAVSLRQARGRAQFQLSRSALRYARSHLREFGSFLSAGYVEASVVAFGNNFDIVLLSALRGPSDVGLYRVAALIVGYTGNLLTPMVQAVLPDIQRTLNLPRQLLLRRMWRLSLVAASLFLAGALIIYIGAPWMVGLVFGPNFASAVGVIRIMIWSAAIAGAAFWLGPLLLALKRPWIRVSAIIVAGAVQLGLLLVLVPRYGSLGAAWAYLAPGIVKSALMLAAVLSLRWPTQLSSSVAAPATPPVVG
jgi:O-antigen/teichoic acid export membrane protein